MPNRVWLDVYDNATLLRLGEGPVFSVVSAKISRTLDGSGSFRAQVMATDARALALLQTNRIVRIWAEDASENMRLRGEGLIANWQLTETAGGVGLMIGGPDILEELKRKSTLIGRIYNQQTLGTVCSDLISLAPGWSVDVDSGISSDVVDARFDGLNLFQAFRSIAKRYGYHIRPSLSSTRTIEIGPFGDDTGLRVHKVQTIHPETLSNPQLLITPAIKEDRILESNNYFNCIIPLGAGEGTAALSLKEAYEENGNGGRTYPIQLITGPDGRTIYYIATTTYPTESYTDFRDDPGSAQRTGQYKDIAPLSNSVADRRNASEALYTAAVADIERSGTEQVSYKLTVQNAKENLLAGDKLRIDYLAQIEVGGHLIDEPELLTYLNVSGDFFIIDANESISDAGSDVELTVSNLDKVEEDDIELIFDTIDQMEVRNLKPNITPNQTSYVYPYNIFAGFPVSVPIEFTNATTELLRVRMRVETFKLVNFLTATGGSHVHKMFDTEGTLISPIGSYSGRVMTASRSGGSDHSVVMPNASDDDMYTRGASGSLTLDFSNPTEDTQTPQSITVTYAGVDVTNDLFGVAALAPSGGVINVVADAGELANLLTNAVGGLQQLHELEFECASGRGAMRVIIDVFATTQAIALS